MSSIGFDFDGVIHSYERGWDDGTIYGTPIDGIFDLIREIQGEHAVFVYSTRDAESIAHWMCRQDKDIRCVTEKSYRSGYAIMWHYDDGVQTNQPMIRGAEYYTGTVKFWNDHERIFVTDRKLPAVAYVDDRAIRFFNTHALRNELRDRSIIKHD